ncbi:MAG: c-type cytochrome [Bacteroidia bacterium]
MQKILFSAISVGLLSLMFSSGCYLDNEEDLYPSNTCDTTSVTYSAISSLLDNNGCLGCHSNSAAATNGAGYDLQGYSDVKQVASSNDLLYKAVAHDSTVTPMPLGGGKISDCDIAKIRKWVDSDYPE